MAISYQVSCAPGAKALLADKTLKGGAAVAIHNSHATEPLVVGGDENELPDGTTLSTSSGFRIPAGSTFRVVLDGQEAIYGRSGTSTVTITAHVFRTNSRQQ